MGGGIPKQFLPLGGVPMLLHSLRAFDRAPSVDAVILVVPREERQRALTDIVERYGVKKVRKVVAGGKTRQESVYNGLKETDPDGEIVLVHDAVRPFIDPSTIEKVIQEAAQAGAAIVGIVPVDTVKQVRRNKIHNTIPRERLILAQTPQVFRYPLLRQAFQRARDESFTATDESSLVERLEEVEVSVVPGSDRNIKITKPSDMELARLFLAEQTGQRKAS